MVHSDRLRRQQILREAEGYLDLVMSLADRWPLSVDLRDSLAQRAIATLDRLKKPAGDRCQEMYLRGQALRVLERFDKAVVPLAEAAQLEPENIHIQLALGWCYKRMGRLDLAIEALEAALAADPSEAVVHYNLACYWSLARNKKRTIDYLSRALAIDANYRDMIDNETDFDPFRDDPDFQALTSVIV